MDCVKQYWQQIHDDKYLIFEFQGHLNDDVAKVAVKEWAQHFRSLGPLEKTNIVWNCQKMSKYSPGAAISWKNALPKFSHQISGIWLITTNPFFKMGARTVTMLTSFKLNLASSYDDFLRLTEDQVTV